MDFQKLLKTQWDRSLAILVTILGGIFLLVGWFGVSGTNYLAAQIPYIVSGGVGGIFFLGIGATLWVSADLRDEWNKLDRIEDALQNGTLRWAEPPSASNDRPTGAPLSQQYPEYYDQGAPSYLDQTGQTYAAKLTSPPAADWPEQPEQAEWAETYEAPAAAAPAKAASKPRARTRRSTSAATATARTKTAAIQAVAEPQAKRVAKPRAARPARSTDTNKSE